MDSPGLPDPIFAREGARWRPHPEAGGPFGGLHGGAISGLIVAEMERQAREHGLGSMLSASVLLLRPAPPALLETRSELLRKGGRTGALETVLLADGKLIAKGMASCISPQPVANTPAEPTLLCDPSSLPPWPLKPRFRQSTLFDALDLRVDREGMKWGRLLRPLVPFDHAFASVFAIADNAPPFSLRDHRHALSGYTFPNVDLSVHASRPVAGGWIGVKARSDWRPEGMGLTDGELYDERGRLGHVCQTIVLVPQA
ncbi:MAG TPA: acyl-CoA thioesterase domain-containing protein [Stellaceae bacterium]|nr:acyl-CoA thioesterase domain-containing protein [Stellaceae bacterium]